MKDLEQAVPDRFQSKVCLHVMATVTVFDKRHTETEWVKEGKAKTCTSMTSTATSPPILKHLLDRKFCDLKIKCEDKYFPAHSIVLKCKFTF